jgi:hypothetical protein
MWIAYLRSLTLFVALVKKPTSTTNLSFLDSPTAGDVVKLLKKEWTEHSYFTYCGPNSVVYLNAPLHSRHALQSPSTTSSTSSPDNIHLVAQACLENVSSTYEPNETPHVWQLVSNSYYMMRKLRRNQLFLVK